MDRDGKCDPSSVHEAASVVEGRKYILQRWLVRHLTELLKTIQAFLMGVQ